MSPDSPAELTSYFHRSIPLTAAMGVRAVETSWAATVLAAPYEANINHEGTFFGGSLSAVALLTGFAALRHRLQVLGHRQRIVVRRNTYSYQRPVTTDVTARAEIEPPQWQDLLDSLQRRAGGKITVEVAVSDAYGRRVGHLIGAFALLPAESEQHDPEGRQPPESDS